MRKLIAILTVALFGLMLNTGLATAAKPPKADEQTVKVVKKKKKKAIQVVSVKQRRAQVSLVKKKQKFAAVVRREQPVRATSYARNRGCNGFFNCLFGPSQRRSATRASLGSGDFSVPSRESRERVEWREARYKPGSIIVRTPERALYYVLPGGEAMRYSVGVGKEGFQWSGNSRIARKTEWPDWRPPQVMIEREAEKGHILPEFMEGGPDNPLGARALYIGGTLFRIHGTNNAASIGGAVSSGCIRMLNADVIDLYDRVKVGSRVYVYQ